MLLIAIRQTRVSHVTFGLIFASLAAFANLRGEVSAIRIHTRELYEGGRSFGAIGQYENIEGVMRFAVDPTAPDNQNIVDIRNAPMNGRGHVEFEADFRLVRPVEASRSNGCLVFSVVNRGRTSWQSVPGASGMAANPTLQGLFSTPDDPKTSAGLLLDRGFSVLEIGWQHDVPATEGGARLFRVKLPVASDHGRPIRGLVAVSFTLGRPAENMLLSDRGHIPYPVADPNDPRTGLTIRHLDGRLEKVARHKWGFRDSSSVYMDGGFAGGRSYEVIYQSENPPITGLGYAGVRDGVAAVRSGQFAELGLGPDTIKRVVAVGHSQSGRFLRGFVHEGFNRDLRGNRVFDGVLALIAGGSRTVINYRFAQPSANPGLFFPFTDESQVDAETGEEGGLLSNLPAATRPKMMYLNTPSEYWRSSNAALIHICVDGSADLPIAEGTRVYVVAGAQHGPAPWPVAKTDREMAPNPLNYRWVTRAAFLAMDRWVKENVEPPSSRYPRIADNELATPAKLGFPAIPGVTAPPAAQTMRRAKLPANFRTEGPITIRPPRPGSPYPHLVSRVNEDGNELGGIVLPELSVPLGTYLAWNQQFPGAKDMTASLGLVGGFVPFPRNEEERQAQRDPRPSLAKRYSSREDFLGRMAVAALKCVQDGYLLDIDVASLLRTAGRQYDDLMARTPIAPTPP